MSCMGGKRSTFNVKRWGVNPIFRRGLSGFLAEYTKLLLLLCCSKQHGSAESQSSRCAVCAAITGSSAGIVLRPLGQGSYSPSAVANGALATFFEETAGSIIVPPGAFLGIAGSATTAGLVQAAMSWCEIDWPL